MDNYYFKHEEEEQTLWRGEPSRGRLLGMNEFILIPLTVIWFAFSIVWLVQVLRMETPIIFPIVGVIVVVIGFYLAIGRLIVKQWRKQFISYELTNKRLIIKKTLFSQSVATMEIAAIENILLKDVRKGIGSIYFGHLGGMSAIYANSGIEIFAYGNRRSPMPLAFYDIEDADRVYNMIDSLR